MSSFLITILITLFLFILFLAFLLIGIKKQRMKLIYLSLLFFIFTIVTGFYSGYLLVSRAYQRVTDLKVENPFRGRSGNEIYIALFGNPLWDCVTVVNQKDQTVPRLDCCIWLEFKTCPEELQRIIALEPYTSTVFAASDTALYMPGYNPKPAWFRPVSLGDSILVLRKHSTDNPNRDQLLFLSMDSTHVFYCDMSD
jgi:hypothetical protein